MSPGYNEPSYPYPKEGLYVCVYYIAVFARNSFIIGHCLLLQLVSGYLTGHLGWLAGVFRSSLLSRRPPGTTTTTYGQLVWLKSTY